MGEWFDDLKKSSAIVKQAEPILAKMLNDKKMKILQVENKRDEVCKTLDTTCGIDYFILSNGNLYGLAWRAQWVEPSKAYNSFTVRKTRDNGTPTEFEKRKKAIDEKAEYPHYVVQAFVDKYTNEIVSLGLSTTETILAYIDEQDVEVRHTGREQIGQAEFYVAYWTDMLIYGYDIKIYKKDVGVF